MPISTSIEKILAIIIILIGVITFSFAIGSLISVLENLDSSEAQLKKKHFELNSIKRKYKLPAALYNKIYKSFKFKIENADSDIDAFISTFPLRLKTELVLEINNEVILKIPYFSDKDDNFRAMASTMFKHIRTYNKEYIFMEGDPIYQIFFLLNGEAGYVCSDNDITLIYQEINKGDMFGELDFFDGEGKNPSSQRQFNVKALFD
jgi:hypothetical protein